MVCASRGSKRGDLRTVWIEPLDPRLQLARGKERIIDASDTLRWLG